MAKRYKWSRIGSRLIYKIRHHKGHGIHSPFVFNLVNNVIEEKRYYYCYEDISKYLLSFDEKKVRPNKRNRLAFRFVNYFGAKNILEIGSGFGVNTLFLTTSSKKIRCICVEQDDRKRDVARRIYERYSQNIDLMNDLPLLPLDASFDCVFINLDYYRSMSYEYLDGLCRQCHSRSFIIVVGIRRNKTNNDFWKHLSANDSRTVVLDLFNVGVVFFDRQLYRWEYKISF